MSVPLRKPLLSIIKLTATDTLATDQANAFQISCYSSNPFSA